MADHHHSKLLLLVSWEPWCPNEQSSPTIHCRIYQRSYLKMLHLATVLVLFAAAAFKSDHTALLAATLVSEAHTAFFLVRRLQVLLGRS